MQVGSQQELESDAILCTF